MTGFAHPRGSPGVKPSSVEPPFDPVGAAFEGKSVFVTGHTGFKGSWLTLWLRDIGALVTGYALNPPTTPSNFEIASVSDALQDDNRADIRDGARLEGAVWSSRPDVILHLAAQSVVYDGYARPAETFSVNVLGTAVLLDAVQANGRPCAVVIVTSDKCYANDESGRPFNEDDPLGGHRSLQREQSRGNEPVAAAYRQSYFPPSDVERHGIAVATARAGNVVGGGDWTSHGVVADTFIRSRPATQSDSGALTVEPPPVAARSRTLGGIPDPRREADGSWTAATIVGLGIWGLTERMKPRFPS